MFSATDISSDI